MTLPTTEDLISVTVCQLKQPYAQKRSLYSLLPTGRQRNIYIFLPDVGGEPFLITGFTLAKARKDAVHYMELNGKDPSTLRSLWRSSFFDRLPTLFWSGQSSFDYIKLLGESKGKNAYAVVYSLDSNQLILYSGIGFYWTKEQAEQEVKTALAQSGFYEGLSVRAYELEPLPLLTHFMVVQAQDNTLTPAEEESILHLCHVGE